MPICMQEILKNVWITVCIWLLSEKEIWKNLVTELYCENNPGDGESKFPVTAWFDDNSIPDALYVDQSSWSYGGKTITIEFQKAE